jgi:hypothetical protein
MSETTNIDDETIDILAERLHEAARNDGAEAESALQALVKKAKALRVSRDKAQSKLDAISDINEEDWEDGSAASWVTRIMAGESIEDLVKDGMETQDALEERFCSFDPLAAKGSAL